MANYRVIIEPDEETGTGKACFTAYVPTLGIADSGDTIDEALKNAEEGIRCYLEALVKDGEPIPESDDVERDLVTSATVPISARWMRRYYENHRLNVPAL